ncbi:MAG: nucleotide sugar dehydrogenase [Proteobacteria bacterium]|nr:nucleotide sugar dehydrogenase [Pseudomonadota bacterium]
MNISVFGLGYVGCVTAACLARHGHRVIGVDVNQDKIDSLDRGVSPIVEEMIGELIAAGRQAGRLSATADAGRAVLETELSLVCVGTPSLENGAPETGFVERVADEIGRALADKDAYHTVAVRSTVLPGTIRGKVIPRLEAASGKAAGPDFGVCFNPEFLREGSSVRDFDHPPKTVIGQLDEPSGRALKEMFAPIDAPLFTVPLEVAEMVKYTDNVFHALKVTFANEIGRLCKAFNVDSHQVMNIFTADTKLNLSPNYLWPGFAFGGSCLPKDTRAVIQAAQEHNVDLPMISHILPSNEGQIREAFKLILKTGKQKIGFLGFAFKGGTDDLRESPVVLLIEALLGKGKDILAYDENVSLARLVGSNLAFIEQVLPHIGRLMADSIAAVVDYAEVIVVGNFHPDFAPTLHRLRADQTIVDLVRVVDQPPENVVEYHGLSW